MDSKPPQTERGSPDAATRVISKIKGKIVSPTNRGETSGNQNCLTNYLKFCLGFALFVWRFGNLIAFLFWSCRGKKGAKMNS